MLGEAQDVLLAAETSLARHHNRGRRGGSRLITEEAPHCVTCYCLDNRQVACGQRCISNGRRHSPRRNTTVDELLREMSFRSTILSDEETYAKNEVEDESSLLVSPARPSRRARGGGGGGGGGSYCAEAVGDKSPETTARSCERWQPQLEVDSQVRSAVKSERHSDGGSKRKWPPSSDRKSSRRLQKQQQLLGAGDRNVQYEEPTKATTVADEEVASSASTSDALAEEAHVRELKLVRWQFIERIHDEVANLHRLQRHLDGCCSPPPTLARRRSVATMTSARQQTSEQPEAQL